MLQDIQPVKQLGCSQTHFGDKPLNFGQCNKSFNHPGRLVMHERNHSWDKPYICDHCNKSLSKSGKLVVLNQTHTGDKPYSCNSVTSYSAPFGI